jgi:plasmid maintenance system antidote protein VapI
MKALSLLIIILVAALLTFGAGFFWFLNRLTPEVVTLNQETARIQAETAKIDASQRLIEKQIAAKITLLNLQNEQVIKASGLYYWSCALAYSFRELWLVWLFASLVGIAVNQRFRFAPQVDFSARGITTTVPAKKAEDLVRLAFEVEQGEIAQKMIAADNESKREAVKDAVGVFNAVKGFLPKGEVKAIAQPEQPAQPALLPKVPTFREIARHLEKDDDLIFGYTEAGEPKTGTWVDLFSSAIGGQSGQGKTATLRNIIAQSLLTGQVATFWVLDWHYPHPKSLLASLGALKDHPAIRWVENPFDIPKLLQEVEDTIDRRLQMKEASEPVKVLVCDEVLILCEKIPQMSHVIRRIGTESRKCGVYGLFSSQTWKADSVGGSEVRDCLTSIISHKMKPKQASMLLQDADQAKIVKELSPGRVLFCPVSGEPEILQVPYCDPGDMDVVLGRLKIPQETPQDAPGTANDDRRDESQAQALKRNMDAHNISLNTLAKEAGIAKSTLSNFLNEKGSMSAEQFAKIQTVLNGQESNVISFEQKRELLHKRVEQG